MMIETVLCYILYNDEVLLLYRNKKKNDFNGGKYIGIGGHLEVNESKEEALVREVKEETGLTIDNYSYRGKIYFKQNNVEEVMHLYTSITSLKDVIDCNEGTLYWIKKKDILNYPHWKGDEIFLDKLFNSNEFIYLSLEYDNLGNLINN